MQIEFIWVEFNPIQESTLFFSKVSYEISDFSFLQLEISGYPSVNHFDMHNISYIITLKVICIFYY